MPDLRLWMSLCEGDHPKISQNGEQEFRLPHDLSDLPGNKGPEDGLANMS